jgi:hypothetical protein
MDFFREFHNLGSGVMNDVFLQSIDSASIIWRGNRSRTRLRFFSLFTFVFKRSFSIFEAYFNRFNGTRTRWGLKSWGDFRWRVKKDESYEEVVVREVNGEM